MAPVESFAMLYSYTDLGLFCAIAALGWGLSLATYRLIAHRYEWPMGSWHANIPIIPVLLGLIPAALAGLYAMNRLYNGAVVDALAIPALGLIGAILWTGVLRVASQVSLFLAPAAAGLLFLTWIGGPDNLQLSTIREGVRQEMRELREQMGLPPSKAELQRRLEQDLPSLPQRKSQPIQ
jgi:hypothetical protein